MNIRSGILTLWILLLPFTARANELRPETLHAWEQYIQSTNAQLQNRLNHGPFLRVEQRPELVSNLVHGRILVEPLAGSGRHIVPYGLVHDWYGAIFVPDAAVDDALSVLSNYSHYNEYFHPTVANSKLLERTQGTDRFSLLMLSKVLFVTVALDSQYESHLACLPEKVDGKFQGKRCYVISYSVRIQQIREYGRSGARTLPPDEGDGYLWRLYNITSLEELDGGVLIENESIGLSRDIPASVRWLVNPILDRLPRNSLSTALQQTRDAICAARLESRRLATRTR